MAAEKGRYSFRRDYPALQSGMARISDLREFYSHPFKVTKDAAMYELMESIRQEGVLVPLLVRPIRKDEGGARKNEGEVIDPEESTGMDQASGSEARYEIIAGHRRRMAAEWAGLTEVPVIIRDMDDDQAVIAMVDSNLQREYLLPSEKAYAYKMRLDAMKHQGKRITSTSAQVEPKFSNRAEDEKSGGSEGSTGNTDTEKHVPIRSNELLARQVGENVNQIKRYIRLTFLIPQILQMVDDRKLALSSAVELSFLKEDEQYDLYAVMDLEQTVPSLPQANRMKRMSQQKGLTMDDIYSILSEIKPNQKEQVKIPMERIRKYFPKEFTPSQQVDLIEKLLAGWAEKYLKMTE